MTRKLVLSWIQPSYLDAAQGAVEERTETYGWYFERAPQIATQCSAKSGVGMPGFAGQQNAAIRRSE